MKFEFHEEDAWYKKEVDAILKQIDLRDAIDRRVEEILRDDVPSAVKSRLSDRLYEYRNTNVVIGVIRNFDEHGKVESILIQKYATP